MEGRSMRKSLILLIKEPQLPARAEMMLPGYSFRTLKHLQLDRVDGALRGVSQECPSLLNLARKLLEKNDNPAILPLIRTVRKLSNDQRAASAWPGENS
jgi:hypothetical protein